MLKRLLLALVTFHAAIAWGQFGPDPAAAMAAQREALAVLSMMDGVWRGEASTTLPSGQKRTITQTERIGPFLGGTVKVIEGRGYDGEGKVSFNALGVVSYDVARKAYTMRAYAMGHAGDFPLVPKSDGYTWEIAQGPATIRYVATIADGRWVETGDRIVAGREPVRFFEMTLQRISDTDWPSAQPVPWR